MAMGTQFFIYIETAACPDKISSMLCLRLRRRKKPENSALLLPKSVNVKYESLLYEIVVLLFEITILRLATASTQQRRFEAGCSK